jgi:hypothetical protein
MAQVMMDSQNTSHEQVEAPLDSLSKNQSVVETHHCSTAITCSVEQKEIWNLIIKWILSPGMVRHFRVLKITRERLENGRLVQTDATERLMLLA